MILPGSTVIVKNENSIYNGYEGCVQRISEAKITAKRKCNPRSGVKETIEPQAKPEDIA